VPYKEIDTKSSIMLNEKRKHIKTELVDLLTKIKIPIDVNIIEDFTEKILGITPCKK
jgi:hypothetical protein